MKIKLIIDYRTYWGQRLFVCGSIPELGAWDSKKAVAMNSKLGLGGVWEAEIEVANEKTEFEYKYFVLNEHHQTEEWEAGINRIFSAEKGIDEIELNDFWRANGDIENVFYTSAFVNALMRPDKSETKKKKAQPKTGVLHRFQINVPRIAQGYKVCIVGSSEALGAWNEEKAVLLDNEKHPLWQVDLALNDSNPISYKYGIFNVETKKIAVWEYGENRLLLLNSKNEGKKLIVRTDEKFRYPLESWRGAGVAIPVFSLRTKNSMGVGEFLDLKLLVDWTKKTGLKLIQILPINDTTATHTWLDCYPYSGISVFALHPMYANLEAMGELSSDLTKQIVAERRERLNALSFVDYEQVTKVKSRYFKMIFNEQKQKFFADKEFKAFFEEAKSWLVPYAVFSYLRDLYGTADFTKWGKYKTVTQEVLDQIADPKAGQYEDVAIHYFIQFHLHKQLLEASDYARQNGVVIKGDIPIGVFRTSVDAWLEPQLYNMDSQAGAPPDDFSITGQNWKFPTYNWNEMAKDGFKWWKSRMQTMSKYFDAFRIDHILGFFRIWEIPMDSIEGLSGYFNPSLPFSKQELAEKGIWFDYERFCKPFIREYMLDDLFHELTAEVKKTYLVHQGNGIYKLKPEFDTQRKVENALATSQEDSFDLVVKNKKIKAGLFSLIGEVLLIEAPFSNGEAFNPRNSMHFTRSYQALDGSTKNALNDLYTHYFYHRHEAFWREQAMQKLPALKKATNMLICGEDLGMVPACVPGVMAELDILSLEVQRMPKDPKREFVHPADNPYMSVTTTATHDTSTLRGWWEEDQAKTQKFYNQILGHGGGAPYFCEAWVVRDILVQHLFSPSMWAVLPLQDLLGMDSNLRFADAKAEQINVPANPMHYWKYRFHMNLEDLLKEDKFNNTLLSLINDSGRNRPF